MEQSVFLMAFCGGFCVCVNATRDQCLSYRYCSFIEGYSHNDWQMLHITDTCTYTSFLENKSWCDCPETDVRIKGHHMYQAVTVGSLPVTLCRMQTECLAPAPQPSAFRKGMLLHRYFASGLKNLLRLFGLPSLFIKIFELEEKGKLLLYFFFLIPLFLFGLVQHTEVLLEIL